MSITLPVGFGLLHPSFGRTLPAEVRALLDSRAVLAFEMAIKAHIEGYACYPGVRVCVPSPQGGNPIWLRSAAEIAAYEAQIPGLVYACLALNQEALSSCHPAEPFQAWMGKPDSDDGIVYASLTFLANGFAVGSEDPTESMEMEIGDLCEALAAEDAEEAENFPTDRFLTLLLRAPESTADSAHTALTLIDEARVLLDQWTSVHPEWTCTKPEDPGDLPFPLAPPDIGTVRSAVAYYVRSA